MKKTILPSGHLEITLDPDDDREVIAGWQGDRWTSLFEVDCGNGWLCVQPEWIGALTDAPIVADEYELSDEGVYTVPPSARVWWFPNYQVEDPVETLLEKGRVVFTRAT